MAIHKELESKEDQIKKMEKTINGLQMENKILLKGWCYKKKYLEKVYFLIFIFFYFQVFFFDLNVKFIIKVIIVFSF